MARTFNVWVILEETVDNSPQSQLETCEVFKSKSEDNARTIFSIAQDLAIAGKAHLVDLLNMQEEN